MPVNARRISDHGRGIAAAVAGTVAYATGPVLIRAALLGGVATWSLLASRMVLGSALMVGILMLLKRHNPGAMKRLSVRDIRDGLLLGMCTYGLQLALFTLALDRASASLVVILFNSFPVFVIGIAALSGRERLTAQTATAVAVSLVGVVIVGAANNDISSDPLGMLLAVASGLGYALMVIGGDALGGRIPPFQLTTLLMMGAALSFLCIMPITGYAPPPSTGTALLIIAIAIAPSVVGTLGIIEGMGKIGPSLVSILMMLEPPIAVFIAWIFLGESLGLVQILGGVLILVGIGLAQRRPRVHEADIELPH